MTFNFAMQAIDHIINSAAKTLYMSAGQISCPIVFRGPNGAAAGVAAQHSQCFAAWYSSVPGLKVMQLHRYTFRVLCLRIYLCCVTPPSWPCSRNRAAVLTMLHLCIQVIAPYDAEDSRGLLKAAIRDPDPVVFLENEILYGESFPVSDEVLGKDFVLPIGKAKVRPAKQHLSGLNYCHTLGCR